MAVKARNKRRQYGSGGVTQRCDTGKGCPDLVPGPPHPKTGKPTKVRPAHKCTGLWMGRIDAGTYPNGKRRQVTVYGRTEAEAKTKLDRKRKQIAAEGKAIATKSRETVRSWSVKWLKKRETTQRPNAYKADVSLMKNWIVPTIGTRRLESLTPQDVEAVAEAIIEAGLTTGTARRAHSVMMQMFKDAALNGNDVPQRILLVHAPPPGSSDRTSLQLDEAVAVLQVAAGLPHGSRWATALLQGVRPMECLGLTWSCVDFEKGLMRIEWQLQPLPYVDPKDKERGFRIPLGYKTRQLVGQWHLVELKTESGYRVIPMVAWIENALRAWRDVSPANEHDLVWPALDGRPASPEEDVEEWRALQDTASILLDREVKHPEGHRHYVRHEARHTTASLLLELGVDPKVITAIMGHSSIITTRGYQHVQTQHAAAALARVAAQLQLVPAPPEPPALGQSSSSSG
ncbi:MAG: site-specific integrase [Hamadaea sp.]|nr:site-specific integrase [Hamadaea sp.]